ncbi:hypothetical protein [Streptomyces sparsus]
MITLFRGRHADVPTPRPVTAVHTYTLPGHPAGGVLAVLTGARADREVAVRAGRFAARTGRKLTVAIAFASTGFSLNALLHLGRYRRLARQADAVLAAHREALAPAETYRSVVTVLPARTNPYHRLPARSLKRLADRAGATTALTSVPLHPPGRHFTLADELPDAPPHTTDPPPPPLAS